MKMRLLYMRKRVTFDEVVGQDIRFMGLQPMLTSNGSKIFSIAAPFSGSCQNRCDTKIISVLYVDESPALANLISLYLTRKGEMTVDTSQSVEDAMLKLRYISYDVIITDYNITEKDGNALLHTARAQGERVPFVYFVAFRDNEFENEAKHYGRVSFIEKMVSSGANLGKLRQAILDAVYVFRANAVVSPDQSPARQNGSAKS
jgi:DNA-binding NtrC family response regulator